jgi:triosephosphate isomerase
MKRRPLLAGNWKMNCTVAEAVRLAGEIRAGLSGSEEGQAAVAPPFTALHAVAQVLKGSTVALAAQNMHNLQSGAFTGEISAPMLKEIGCTYVILGHSERRQFFHESDADINRKVRAALAAELTPILCVGELLGQRKANETMDVIRLQVSAGLSGLKPGQVAGMVIAYEPVWAIGTGETATPAQAEEVHSFIRSHVAGLFGADAAGSIRIQYGGSVKPDNIDELISREGIDGALVGGAGLVAKSFIRIVKYERRNV